MKVDDLTEIENNLEDRMPSGGYLEQRDAYLQKEGLYEEWRNLFVKYANLALANDIEALKRALFFLWYQCATPNQLSGLLMLDEVLIEKILRKIDSMVNSNELDIELQFMLPFYYQISEWYFERFSGLSALKQASLSNHSLWKSEVLKVSWDNRGIMGEYWASKGA